MDTVVPKSKPQFPISHHPIALPHMIGGSDLLANHFPPTGCWLDLSTGLNWTGLDWTGLDCTGLDWTGLDWTGLDWTGLDWT